MPLEDMTGPNVYISNMVPTNPPGTDDPVQGDDHLRGIKNCTINTWPNVTGPVTATQDVQNAVDSGNFKSISLPIIAGLITSDKFLAGAPTGADMGVGSINVQTGVYHNGINVESIGAEQTWGSVTRVVETVYTNSTGRPIQVCISAVGDAPEFRVNGVAILKSSLGVLMVNVIIPNSASYSLSYNGQSGVINSWNELR